MQREIKFRTWYKPESKFYFGIDACAFPEFTYSWRDGNRNNYIIQQYTGLKDKNGVEIYEGDIVEIVGGLVPLVNRQKNAKYVIEYLAPSFTYKIINGQHMCGCGYTNPSIPEIIGNIFENPELLELCQY